MSLVKIDEQEKKSKGRNLAWILALKDKELIAEQTWERKNICRKCNMVLTKRGVCPMDC